MEYWGGGYSGGFLTGVEGEQSELNVERLLDRNVIQCPWIVSFLSSVFPLITDVA